MPDRILPVTDAPHACGRPASVLSGRRTRLECGPAAGAPGAPPATAPEAADDPAVVLELDDMASPPCAMPPIEPGPRGPR
jgi:hypothetical protein